MTDGHVHGHLGRCTTCGKACYRDKASAKAARKRMPKDKHLSAYRCGDYWHLGNLPRPVVAGTIPRSRILPSRPRPLPTRTTPTEGAPPS